MLKRWKSVEFFTISYLNTIKTVDKCKVFNFTNMVFNIFDDNYSLFIKQCIYSEKTGIYIFKVLLRRKKCKKIHIIFYGTMTFFEKCGTIINMISVYGSLV